jgi:hypothetical protein
MTTEVYKPTTPKPFVFVLMPFDPKFDDIYKFGIKGAAEEIGAFAQRLDEQIFDEGMVERIFNQISKADVIVADMTGQNPNVFYEAGYAHALGKIAILLTQDAKDIPFDFKNRPHIVYGGIISKLKSELIPRLQWAVTSSRDTVEHVDFAKGVDVSLDERTLIASPIGVSGPTVSFVHATSEVTTLHFQFVNNQHRESDEVLEVFLYVRNARRTKILAAPPDGGGLISLPCEATPPEDNQDGLTVRCKLEWIVPALPAGAIHSATIMLDLSHLNSSIANFRLQLRMRSQSLDYPFIISLR